MVMGGMPLGSAPCAKVTVPLVLSIFFTRPSPMAAFATVDTGIAMELACMLWLFAGFSSSQRWLPKRVAASARFQLLIIETPEIAASTKPTAAPAQGLV